MPNDKRSHYKRLGRELAMQFLFQFDCVKSDFDDADLVLFLERAKDAGEVDERRFKRAAKYAGRLVSTIVEKLEAIDAEIKALLSKDWSWERLALVDKAMLRVAVAEMLCFDDVPLLVTIDEAVEISKKFGAEPSKSFINGLLDALKNKLEKAR